jgi:phosphatidate cytidylyltransferase
MDGEAITLGPLTLAAPLALGFALVFALLILGTIAAVILPAMQPGKWTDLGPRMRSWWVIVVLVAGALLLGWQATAILFALISFLALKEFLTLAPTRKEDRLVVLLAYLSVFVNYGLIFADDLFEDSYQIYLVFVPVYGFLIAAAAMAWIGRTDGYLATVGIVHWGTVVCV